MALSVVTMTYLEIEVRRHLENKQRSLARIKAQVEELSREYPGMRSQIDDFKADVRLLQSEDKLHDHALRARWIPWSILDVLASADIDLEVLKLDQGLLRMRVRTSSEAGSDAIQLGLGEVEGIQALELFEVASSSDAETRFLVEAELPFARANEDLSREGAR